VLIAPVRALRPHDVGEEAPTAACPFCPGNEHETPPTRAAVGDGPTGWGARAFANRYPAIDPAEGEHEVIVNSPRHVLRMGDLTDDEAVRAVGLWADRLAAVTEDARGLWPFLFLNQGASAGASLQHTHAQIVGLPFGPPRLVARERVMAATPRCPVCADVAGAGGRTVIDDGSGLVAFCPKVPPLSGTLRIAPVAHAPHWASGLDAAALGRMLPACARAVGAAVGGGALNLWLHQRGPGGTDRHHWHIDMLPRIGTLAGMELGAGVIAVALAPEDTAARLRGALV
jgi:UDPglucose--hexose-1-phosphate uridylyltransferase